MMASLKKGNQANIPLPKQMRLPDEQGKYITRDAALVGEKGWDKFVT